MDLASNFPILRVGDAQLLSHKLLNKRPKCKQTKSQPGGRESLVHSLLFAAAHNTILYDAFFPGSRVTDFNRPVIPPVFAGIERVVRAIGSSGDAAVDRNGGLRLPLEFSKSRKRLAFQSLLLLLWGNHRAFQAQGATPWTVQLGAGISDPVGRTSDFVRSSVAFTAGLGYRFSPSETVLLEYYATPLPFHGPPLTQLSFLHPTSILYSLATNYKREFFTSSAIHPYVVGGGGWYRRKSTITRPTVIGIACSTWLIWYHEVCEEGSVPLDKIVAASTSDALGFNAGAGLSGRIGKVGLLSWYLEIRYHHAPDQDVPTRTLPVTFGLIW
jgi:hypothetical protein